MKKIIIIASVVLMALVVGGLVYPRGEGLLGGSVIVADSTLYQLSPNESKQVILDVRDASGAFFDISLEASTSAAVLSWTHEFTNDSDCGFNADPTACTWYGEDKVGAGTADSVTHSSTTVLHTWTQNSATASTTNKRIEVADVYAKFMRTTFTVTGATSTITIQQGTKI